MSVCALESMPNKLNLKIHFYLRVIYAGWKMFNFA